MLAVIRIRGRVNVERGVEKTLRNLKLTRKNHLVIFKENKNILGMLSKVQNYITFGEINKETLALVLLKRGRLSGNKKLDKKFLEERGLKGFEEISEGLFDGRKNLKDLGIKPVFRLSPPKKGFERGGMKKSFKQGGVLGYRGEKINELIKKMV